MHIHTWGEERTDRPDGTKRTRDGFECFEFELKIFIVLSFRFCIYRLICRYSYMCKCDLNKIYVEEIFYSPRLSISICTHIERETL
jgi:hypothetical protein